MPIFHSWGWVGMTPKTKWKLISQRLIWKLRCISKSLALQIPSICPEERKNNALCSNTKYKLKWIWVSHYRRLRGEPASSPALLWNAASAVARVYSPCLKHTLRTEEFLRELGGLCRENCTCWFYRRFWDIRISFLMRLLIL